MIPRVLRAIGVYVFFLLVAVVLTWPLALNLRTTVSDLGDPLLNVWIINWDQYALTHAPLHLFDAPMYYPAKYPLAYSENMLGIALVTMPFYLAGAAPVTVYNIAVLLGFAFAALGGYVLGRVITGRFMPSIVAGLLYGFTPFTFSHLPHLQITWNGWLPLILAAILVYRRAPTWRNAALLGGAFLMNGLTNIYFLLFSSVALVLSFALMAIAASHPLRFWMRIGAALGLASLLLVPVLIPYNIVSDLYGMKRGEAESEQGSATPSHWLITSPTSVTYRWFTDNAQRHAERELFPGLLIVFLGLAAFLLMPARNEPPVALPRRRLWPLDAVIVALAVLTYVGAVTDQVRIEMGGHLLVKFDRSDFFATLLVICIIIRLTIRFPRGLGEGNLRTAIGRSRIPLELWIAALWIVIGFLGSLGMHAFFHTFLFHKVSAFRAIRAAARWAIMAYVGLAAWAAAGVAAFRPRKWLAPLLVVLAIVEVWPAIHWVHALVEPDPVDIWLAKRHAGPFAMMPFYRDNASFFYLLHSTVHHAPMFNGTSGFAPPLHTALRLHGLDDVLLDLLEKNGCRFIVFRPDWFSYEGPAAGKWVERGLASGRLAFLQRFDGQLNGDYVFALTRVEKNWQRYRAAQVPDGAGFTPDQELARMLAGKQTYNSRTFGRFGFPQGDDVTGRLIVAGFALSPWGIRSATVLVDNGRFRYPAPLFPREDVTATWPWYPRTPLPAFSVALPRRPRTVRADTDVQVEIIDGRGQRTMLPDRILTWR